MPSILPVTLARIFGTLVGTQGLVGGGLLVDPAYRPVIGAVVGIYVYDWLGRCKLTQARASWANKDPKCCSGRLTYLSHEIGLRQP